MTTLGHTILEASAGTGKTYSIEGAVARLLVDDGIPLEQILIVTFTEAATGELRRRIRERLEALWKSATVQGSPDTAARIHHGLRDFDRAAIFTIHGFCQRVLSEYAFETGQPFEQQVLDDPLLWERLFARSLRSLWRRELLDPPATPRSQTAYANDYHRDTIIGVTQRFSPRDDTLVPDPAAYPAAYLPLVHSTCTILGDALDELESRFDAMKAERTAAGMKVLIRKQLILDNARPLQELCRQIVAEGPLPAHLDALPDACKLIQKSENNLREYALLSPPELTAFVMLTTPESVLMPHAIRHLHELAARQKREGGLIDFTDMICLTRDALLASPALVTALRARYRVALVDEFQDTDQAQWQIFQTVFTGQSGHRLIIVGDPKQAIYSFRGANVQTYLTARAALQQAGATLTPLETNWRSYPLLLGGLNRMFCSEYGNFFGSLSCSAPVAASADATPCPHRAGQVKVQCPCVKWPEKAQIRACLHRDDSGRPPLALVRLPEGIKATEGRTAFARFVAREIHHLLASGLEIAGDTGPRALHAGDICILIRTRGELPALARALREAKLSYTFPKAGGLFATPEAVEFLYLLRAIATPEDSRAVMTALLTRFFPTEPEELFGMQDQSATHPLKACFLEWHQWATRRAWPRLFRSLLSSTGVLTREIGTDDGERRVTNYQHLAQLLLARALGGHGSLRDLMQYLDEERRHAGAGGDETDLLRVETEKRKVRIMTMHTAKGLEFPILFIAGGFSARNASDPYLSYTTPRGRVYDFLKQPESAIQADAELMEDQRRLYYVALTRAKYKLYIPVIDRPRGGKKNVPLTGLIRETIQRAWPPTVEAADTAYLPISLEGYVSASVPPWTLPDAVMTGVGVEAIARAIGSEPAQEMGAEGPARSPDAPVLTSSALSLPVVPDGLHSRRAVLASFSSLCHQLPAHPQPDELPAMQYELADDSAAERAPMRERRDDDDHATAVEEDTLPRGTQIGTLLHAAFEQLDYRQLLAAPAPAAVEHASDYRQIMDQLYARYPLRTTGETARDRAQIAELIWRTARTPLPFLGGTPIGAISERRHELDFLLPAPDTLDALPEIVRRDRYLTGVIDLIFRHAGKYYILDWKSNWSPTGQYGPSVLQAMMAEHHYDLQYKLYLVALERYLRLQDPDFAYARDIGGVCYLFVRGLTGEPESPGIFFDPMPETDFRVFLERWPSLL